MDRPFDQRADVRKRRQPQLLHQPLGWRPAIFQETIRSLGKKGWILPTAFFRENPSLVLNTDVLGVKVFWARIKTTEITLTAENGALNIGFAHQVKA